MRLLVTMRTLGKKRPVLDAVPFSIEGTPGTLRGLIEASVTSCVAAYNARIQEKEAPAPMDEDHLATMAILGKMAFDVDDGGRLANLSAALETAMQAYEDGLYRVFHGETELTDLDAPLILHEDDRVTFIRLTFLTGGYF